MTDRAPWAGPPSERQRRNRRQKIAVVAGLLALAGVVLVVVVSGSWNQPPQISLDRLPTALTEHVPPQATTAPQDAPNRAVGIAPVLVTPAESPSPHPVSNGVAPTRSGPAEAASMAPPTAPLTAPPTAPPTAPLTALPTAPPTAPLTTSPTAPATNVAQGGNLPDELPSRDAGPPAANDAAAATTDPAAAPTVAPAAPPAAAKLVDPAAAATSPRAACGARTEFSLYRCMQQQCESRRWSSTAQCVRFRETDSVE